MKKYIVIVFILIYTWASAQYPLDSKRDYQWRIGTRYGYIGVNPYGNSLLDFTQSQMFIDTMTNHVPLQMTNANICDTSGQLLFTANGCFIYNREGEKVDPTQLACEDLCTSFLQTGNNNQQINLLLPQPGNDSVIYLFHNTLNGEIINNVSIYDDTTYSTDLGFFGTLYVSKLNIKGNNGLGSTISMNEQISEKDSVNYYLLTACRHANGRDWWIMVPTMNDNLYYTYLLSPSGLELKLSQRVGGKVYFGAGYACFSPDGTKYARAEGVSVLLPYYYNIYDFDRCTGRLTNPVFLKHTEGTSVGWVPSVAFSASSRYMYLGACDRIYQYDMEASNWLDTKIMVDSFDGFKMPTPPFDSLPITFDNMQLAPDGKIYISSGQNTRSPYLHVIHAPDSAGVACNVEQRAITLIKPTASNLPSNPNYRLGPVDGSGCDTLGIDNIVVSVEGGLLWEGVKLYPNPSTGTITIEKASGGTLGLYDIQGKLLLSRGIKSEKETLSLGNLPEGLYIWRVEDLIHGGYETGKLVIQR
ncbi:MAG: T9SS type A sorting domain-containing protein [Bacteroidia bacterium]|nr:T9SS type A sorting domain-containing protein [Bacteroidia bacterium]